MGKKSPGHIEQLPSGSWRVKVYGGTDPLTGREIRLRKTCKTERAAQIELGRLLEQAEAGRQPERADLMSLRRAADLPGSRWPTGFGTRSAPGC